MKFLIVPQPDGTNKHVSLSESKTVRTVDPVTNVATDTVVSIPLPGVHGNGYIVDVSAEVDIPSAIEAHKALLSSQVYKAKRTAEYPPAADYLDAKVKQASTDPTIVAAGQAQEATYLAACLAVKAKYPKPQ